MNQELPILSERDRAQIAGGIENRNPADAKLYPVPGQGINKEVVDESNLLPVIEVQHLTTAPTLKSWMDAQEGEPLCEEHAPIIQALKNARANGAPINLNINPDGKYDRAFSGANGNMVEISDFKRLLDAGLNLGDCLRVTKLVCGPNGVCGSPGPCVMCQNIRDGCYDDVAFEKPESAPRRLLDASDPLNEEINLLVEGEENYELTAGGRVMNLEFRKSAGVEEIKNLCRETGKGVIFVLEMLGIYRATEAESHTALKRGDLGGH